MTQPKSAREASKIRRKDLQHLLLAWSHKLRRRVSFVRPDALALTCQRFIIFYGRRAAASNNATHFLVSEIYISARFLIGDYRLYGAQFGHRLRSQPSYTLRRRRASYREDFYVGRRVKSVLTVILCQPHCDHGFLCCALKMLYGFSSQGRNLLERSFVLPGYYSFNCFHT